MLEEGLLADSIDRSCSLRLFSFSDCDECDRRDVVSNCSPSCLSMLLADEREGLILLPSGTPSIAVWVRGGGFCVNE